MATICVMFSAAVYHFANNELHSGLQRQTERLTTQFPGFNFDPALHPQRDYQDGSHKILLNLVYFNSLVLIVGGFASYGLARRTLRPIEQSHRHQQRFTADVSHELRTPLTSLKISSEVALLDKSTSKAELSSALRSNLEDANRLETLINTLLRLAQLDSSQLAEQFETVKVRRLVDDAKNLVRDQAAAKSIVITSKISQDLQVQGDSASLSQLVAICLDNAIKYSSAGSPVNISSNSTNQTVHISIVDQGEGITGSALPHIFERFYRADSARTNSGPASANETGFGLGLSIAKSIADLHRGHLQVTSQTGKGTTVTLLLPSATQ